MINNIEDYFTQGCDRCAKFATPDCSTQIWGAGLAQLRALCLDLGLVECVKWGHPCYMHADRNIANIGAFRTNFRINFFNAGLLRDPAKILEKQGPNTQNPGMVSFTSNDAVAEKEPLLRTYLIEAMKYASKGIKAPKTIAQYDVPVELIEAMQSDPEFADAFGTLTPGRQRGYYIHIGSAKQSATRNARIEKARLRIFAGKGFNER